MGLAAASGSLGGDPAARFTLTAEAEQPPAIAAQVVGELRRLESCTGGALGEPFCMLAARIGDDRLTRVGEARREGSEDGGDVPLLVEHIRREDDVERRARQPAGVPPVEDERPEDGPVSIGVLPQRGDRLRRPVGRRHAGAVERGEDRGETDPAPELEHRPTDKVAAREEAGERETCRPDLGPVRHVLVRREPLLVDHVRGVARTHDGDRGLLEREPLLDDAHPATMPGMRKRLDVVLVERGLAETRSQAQALVIAGLVPGFDKPGTQVDEDVELVVDRPPRFVSRGGEKLANALEALRVDPAGRDCVDIGASTGGFTECLLQAGARRVAAVDVGYGQLHPRLRADRRVTVMERVNARLLTELPFAPELIVCDVSFISVKLVIPPVVALASADWEALVLVKPQFEAGRPDVPKGVVRDPDVHRRVLLDVCSASAGWCARVLGVVDSRLPGPKGNREFFVHLVESQEPADLDDVEQHVERAVRG